MSHAGSQNSFNDPPDSHCPQDMVQTLEPSLSQPIHSLSQCLLSMYYMLSTVPEDECSSEEQHVLSFYGDSSPSEVISIQVTNNAERREWRVGCRKTQKIMRTITILIFTICQKGDPGNYQAVNIKNHSTQTAKADFHSVTYKCNGLSPSGGPSPSKHDPNPSSSSVGSCPNLCLWRFIPADLYYSNTAF